MADGEDTPASAASGHSGTEPAVSRPEPSETAWRLRSATPTGRGPLASSGAAPEQSVQQRAEPVPHQRARPEPAGMPEPPAEPVRRSTAEPPDAGQAEIAAPARGRHAVPEIPPPHPAAPGTARAVRAWARRPKGRLTGSSLLLLALVVATAIAGGILVPAIVSTPGRVAVDASGSASPSITQPPTAPAVTLGPTAPPTGGVAAGRPADVLAGWAQQTGGKIGVSPVAMQAYGYAELVLAQTTPTCRLSWTTLAAIGLVESTHGQHGGATLVPNGQALPEIIGPALDGKDGRQQILDTDDGQLDRDPTYDHAVGPMQFIPSTWRESGIDADNDGVKNPHDIDDAALAAGNYLCKGGRNMSAAQDWWNAILSYNDVRPYVQQVFDAANRYGTSSRT